MEALWGAAVPTLIRCSWPVGGRERRVYREQPRQAHVGCASLGDRNNSRSCTRRGLGIRVSGLSDSIRFLLIHKYVWMRIVSLFCRPGQREPYRNVENCHHRPERRRKRREHMISALNSSALCRASPAPQNERLLDNLGPWRKRRPGLPLDGHGGSRRASHETGLCSIFERGPFFIVIRAVNQSHRGWS
jgi:hypothetical protein